MVKRNLIVLLYVAFLKVCLITFSFFTVIFFLSTCSELNIIAKLLHVNKKKSVADYSPFKPFLAELDRPVKILLRKKYKEKKMFSSFNLLRFINSVN